MVASKERRTMADTPRGRFVWHELMTTDTKGAIAFYSEVIGWKTLVWEDGNYTMWVSPQGTMGGVNPLPEEAKKAGAPPHWMSNVSVGDVDAATSKAKGLGANILMPPADIPKIGRFSVIADPQGATVALFKPLEPAGGMTPHDITKPGEFCWGELIAADYEAAFKFYSQVVGWEQLGLFDMGPTGKYLLFGKDGTQYGGMFTKSADMKFPPCWLYYVEVKDLDGTIERIKSKGGKLMNGPVQVPTGSRIAQMIDPQGAAFAIHELAKN
jgi:predicted enzyme related to lactoylglutathione lyase